MAEIDNTQMSRALTGGVPPIKDNQPVEVGSLGGGGPEQNAYIKKLNAREELLKNRSTLANNNVPSLATNIQGGNIMANTKPNNMIRAPIASIRGGGTYLNLRRAQEGNIALPIGGMPPPPTNAGVSPDLAKEAASLGIEVAPPGATAEEVADDQLVLLSEGELVVPANVVRYHGLAQYEKMRKVALEGLTEMDQQGQLVNPQENLEPEGLVTPDTLPV